MQHLVISFRDINSLANQTPVYPININHYGLNCPIKHSTLLNLHAMNFNEATELLEGVYTLFYHIPCLNASFLRTDFPIWRENRHNIDFEMLEEFTNKLIYTRWFKNVILFVKAISYYNGPI